ncbi:hypothetical protein DICVIV_10345 [Dictyocaulus viviparus]|uniref:Uncharacterized protein n=1 Tax=Dictyocaulus viviparus TaxID=29172 RepID=A0A0D8XIN7_DICVI|nr:hypothetical protein DICVIV_10345 [Dictyocaulus viviparus]
MTFLLECFEKRPFGRIVITEYHNVNVPDVNIEEEERSEEDTGDRKEDKLIIIVMLAQM